MPDGLPRRPIVVVHDVASAQRLIDVARVVYGLGFETLVASKVYGGAAASAVPEVARMALKAGRGFHVLPSARDAVELFSPSTVVVVSRDYGDPMKPREIAGMLRGDSMLILGGVDAAPSRDVAGLGRAVYPVGAEARLGPAAEAAIVLYELLLLEGGGDN